MNLRMPADLKGRLESIASTSGRSLTAEIVMRLERTFEIDAVEQLQDRFREAIETGSSKPRLPGEPLKYQGQAGTSSAVPAILSEISAAIAAETAKAVEEVMRRYKIPHASEPKKQGDK